MNWQVGMKAVFVGYPVPTTRVAAGKLIDRVPYCELGSVYVVQGVEQRAIFKNGRWKGPSLNLGFVDPIHGPVWHHSSGFRPVVERKTDIGVFTELLNTAPEQVPA